MSDNIVINITPPSVDNILVNTTTQQENISIDSTASPVLSVNGKVGIVVLNKNDIGLDQVDNTSDLNKPLSNSVVSALLLKVDLSLLQSLSGDWQTAYLNVLTNSAAYLSAVDLTFLSVSSNWNSTYTTVLVTSSIWNKGYEFATIFANNSSKYENTFSFLNSNSGEIINSFKATSWVFQNSAREISVSTVVNNTSANWNTAFNRSTVFSTVSGRYNNSSTIVESNSANWNYAYNVTSVYSSTSSTFATNSTVNSVSSLLTPLTLTNNLTSQLVLNTDFNSYKTNVASATSTLLPTTIYQNASGSFATNTLLQYTSSLLTPLTLTNNLTSQLVLNVTFNNYKTNVASATSTLLPTTIYQNASGNWQNTFTNVQSNSSNWNTAFDRSTVFTNISSRYNRSSTIVESNSANWNNAYNTGTVYQANSATYATYNFVNSNFLNLTGGTIEGNLNVNGNFYIAGSAANINVRDLVITDPLIFLAEGNPSDILDIGFTASYKSNGDPHKHTGLVRSHINKKWTLFSGLSTEVLSALSINFNDPSLQIDTLRANLEGNVVGGTVQGNTLSSTGLVYAQGGNSDNWNIAFDISTQYQNVSSTFATNTTVNSVSSQLVLNTDFNNYKTSVASSTATLLPTTIYQNASGNWQSAYTTVQNNSATTWNYQGTDLKDLSANWQGTFTNVQSNSANWNIAYNTSLSYQSVSGTFATNTLLQSNSALLTPLTLTNNLTSQLVLNTAFNNYQTSVATTTATLLPTTIYQQSSGNWQSTYTTFSQNSGNYCTKSLALAFAIAL